MARRRFFIFSQLLILIAALVVAAATTELDHWRSLELVGLLAVLAIASDLVTIPTRHLRISGVHVVFVLAMALCGPAPAMLIALISVLVAATRERPRRLLLLNNVATYATFPLVGGLAIAWAQGPGGIDPHGAGFLIFVFAVFLLSNLLNFTMSVGALCVLEGRSLIASYRTMFLPVLPSELATGLLAVGIVWFYEDVGLAAFALLAGVLFTFQYLLRELLLSHQRAAALESLHLGMVSAMVYTLDLRDRMTARHSAAVARYVREIAQELELPARDQELVHTAWLLHDIGKFAFPDPILQGATTLSDDDWRIVRSHPADGARIARHIEGYGPVSEIILCHHERIDGTGYPQQLKGDEIPLLSRIISVADTYDVMTARDSYRKPVSSMEAIHELRRVSGAQLDGAVVEAFIGVLAGRDVRFRHGEDVDFGAELALEARVPELAPVGGSGR
ncbi:MAG: HD-GYP domain-containing protein [Solirubrobacteraceae bacterium]